MACTAAGELCSFGDGGHLLGHSADQFSEPMPRVVKGALTGKRVIGVSASGVHTAVWTDTGELFTFGYGYNGKLGHGSAPAAPDADDDGLDDGPGHPLDVSQPKLVEFKKSQKKYGKVVGAAAGPNYTLAWTDKGKLFIFGFEPKLMKGALEDKFVVGACCQGDPCIASHAAVWTKCGELFTFGYGIWGKLGHGGEENVSRLEPRRVEALMGEKVAGAATSSRHTVVWTAAGELFTFGQGEHGQLGHGPPGSHGDVNEYVPRLVESLAGKVVVGATASASHTVVWTEDNQAFACGNGEFGQLGIGGRRLRAPMRRIW
jgi:alpha-tubulin suppressor-like RCC1 family protein